MKQAFVLQLLTREERLDVVTAADEHRHKASRQRNTHSATLCSTRRDTPDGGSGKARGAVVLNHWQPGRGGELS